MSELQVHHCMTPGRVNPVLVCSGVQKSDDAQGDCLVVCPLPNSIEQSRMVHIVTGYMLFVMSQYDVISTFANQRFCEVP